MRQKISGKLHKRNQAKKEFIKISKQAILTTGLLLSVLLGLKYLLISEVEYVAVKAPEQPKIATSSPAKPKKVVSATEQEKLEIVRKIAQQFPTHQTIMVSIALEESRLNPKAIGYNCFYKGNVVYKERVSGAVSKACQPEHKSFAWSKDGGLLQIHQPTAKDMTVDGNLASAKQKFDTQGLSAWSAYNSGRYKKNIPEAQKLLAML